MIILTQNGLMNELYSELKKFGKLKTNEPLSSHTTYRIGGKADYFLTVDNTQSAVALFLFLNQNSVDYFVIGCASNILAPDEGFSGVVVQMKNSKVEINGETVIADAGVLMPFLSRQTIGAGLAGLEWAIQLPGSVGGTVYGNAGAMGERMSDSVDAVTVLRDGEVIELNKDECKFGYKESIFKKNKDIILSVKLKLRKAGSNEGMKKALDFIKARSATQPKFYGSAGCSFKNIEIKNLAPEIIKSLHLEQKHMERKMVPAGWLIEKAGLKGKKIGGAQISESHGNFILNMGGATAQDIKDLVAEVKQAVYDKFGILIEEEIIIL
jgi:UDP-N-acetylmuramate dehydrogenase